MPPAGPPDSDSDAQVITR